MRNITFCMLLLSVLFYKNALAEGAWTVYNEDNGLGLKLVYSIKASPDGTVWCGGDNGVFCFDGEIWHDYTNMANHNGGIAISDDGIIWFGGSNGLIKYDGIEWVTYSSDDGFSSRGVRNLGVDSNGIVWSSTNNGLLRFDGTDKRLFTTDDGLVYNYANRLLVTQNGDVWCSYNDPIFCEGNPEPGGEEVDCRYAGISHFDGEKWETFDVDDGLLSNNIYSIASDKNDNVFISYGNTSGISMYNGEYWETISTEYGSELAIDHNGILWSVWGGGSENERLRSFSTGIWIKNYGMPFRWFVYSMDVDTNGVVWLATSDGVLCYDPITSFIEKSDFMPEEFEITGNYPNPFNGSTNIQFFLPHHEMINITIHSITGQKIRRLVSNEKRSGLNVIVWDGNDDNGLYVPSGLYFVLLQAKNNISTHSIIYVK